MNKRYLIAWIVAFVLWMCGGFVVHGALLSEDYMKVAQLFRSPAESERYFPLMVLAHLIMAGALVWIYSRGVEATPWLGQGLRFGLAASFLAVVPTYTIYFVVQPMPGATTIKQIIFDTLVVLVVSAAVAWFYRDGKRG